MGIEKRVIVTVLTIPASVPTSLGVVYGPVAGLITVMSVIFFMRYKLNRSTHAAIRREIGRAAASSGCHFS